MRSYKYDVSYIEKPGVLGNKTSKDDTYSRLCLICINIDVIFVPEHQDEHPGLAGVLHGNWKAVEIVSVEWVIIPDLKR